jgi:hypothetical protein
MGYIAHNAIVVTSYDYKSIVAAQQKAFAIFGFSLVSSLVASSANSYQSFFVAPDGSKEGWETSDQGDQKREKFREWLDEQRFSDRSSPFTWVEVRYSSEDGGEWDVVAHT